MILLMFSPHEQLNWISHLKIKNEKNNTRVHLRKKIEFNLFQWVNYFSQNNAANCEFNHSEYKLCFQLQHLYTLYKYNVSVMVLASSHHVLLKQLNLYSFKCVNYEKTFFLSVFVVDDVIYNVKKYDDALCRANWIIHVWMKKKNSSICPQMINK